MDELTWAQGLSLWIIGGGFVAWLFGVLASRGRCDEEWDNVADRKRRIARRAKQLSGEYK